MNCVGECIIIPVALKAWGPTRIGEALVCEGSRTNSLWQWKWLRGRPSNTQMNIWLEYLKNTWNEMGVGPIPLKCKIIETQLIGWIQKEAQLSAHMEVDMARARGRSRREGGILAFWLSNLYMWELQNGRDVWILFLSIVEEWCQINSTLCGEVEMDLEYDSTLCGHLPVPGLKTVTSHVEGRCCGDSLLSLSLSYHMPSSYTIPFASPTSLSYHKHKIYPHF